MTFLDRLSPKWRCRVIGIAIGTPVGIVIGIFTVWISNR